MEPRTRSGREMLTDRMYRHAIGWVTSIEAEARAALLDELEAAVRGLGPGKWATDNYRRGRASAVLELTALIQQHRETT